MPELGGGQLTKIGKKDIMRSALEKGKSTKLTLLPSKLSSSRSRELLVCLNFPYFLFFSLPRLPTVLL